MRNNAVHKNADKFRGCMIGGAAGDALGYTVEFQSEKAISRKFGPEGIREYELQQGNALISDDTQMTMFTANGLLFEAALSRAENRAPDYTAAIATAYREWILTQRSSFIKVPNPRCWLMNVPELFACRAPGLTCMRAINDGCNGTPEKPITTSKGCGGVMRVAPIGLFPAEDDILTLDRRGAEAAALTHGHEMGYIPGAMLVHIVRLAAFSEGVSLKDIVLDSRKAMTELFPDAGHLPGFLKLMDKAMELAESDVDDKEAIHALGPGWVGDEALAVAVYCALKYADDFDKAMIASVNHGGDSDSTGAIAGNILGAYLGLSRIPEKYLQNLELKEELLELAEDLYTGWRDDARWQARYLNACNPRLG